VCLIISESKFRYRYQLRRILVGKAQRLEWKARNPIGVIPEKMIRWIDGNQPMSHAIPVLYAVFRPEHCRQNSSRINLGFVDFVRAHSFTRCVLSLETNTDKAGIEVYVEIIAISPYRVSSMVGHFLVLDYPINPAKPVYHVVVQAMATGVFEQRLRHIIKR